MTRARLFILVICGIALLVVLAIGQKTAPPIRIGVIISQTGPLAVSEKPMLAAVQLAVAEINREGGLLDRQVEIVAVDGQSDNQVFAQQAKRLIEQEKVSALFACWTSSCRKVLLPIVESHQHLLFYPVQYEGAEQSEHIIYTGALPNQQTIPALHWASNNLSKRVYLVGSDYLYPHLINHIIHELSNGLGIDVVGENYFALGGTDVSAIIAEISRLKPGLIINTTNGIANQHLFAALQQHNLSHIPILSTSVTEEDLQVLPELRTHPAHYVAASYFQSLPGAENQKFIQDLKQQAGAELVTSAPVLSIYNSVKLWASAVRDAQTDDPADVNRTIIRQSVTSPSGAFAIDVQTRHSWLPLLIGRAQADGQFKIIYRSPESIKPIPFPDYQSKSEWLQEVAELSKEAQ